MGGSWKQPRSTGVEERPLSKDEEIRMVILYAREKRQSAESPEELSDALERVDQMLSEIITQ